MNKNNKNKLLIRINYNKQDKKLIINYKIYPKSQENNMDRIQLKIYILLWKSNKQSNKTLYNKNKNDDIFDSITNI